MVDKVDRVNQKCVINWHSSRVDVLVEEEDVGWLPDCLVDLEEEEEDSAVGMGNTVVEEEGDKGVEEGEIAMEDIEIQDGSRKSGLDNVIIQNGDIQDVISNQFTEGSRLVMSKKKRRKSMRKKSPGKSPSYSDPGRPKKRQRDGSDPFYIDRFIFLEPNHLVFESTSGNQDGDFVTPDLNNCLDSNEGGCA
ncbi:hypothetical protein Hanom_Chr12g01082211 [Helianthus anomalus]